MDRYDEFNLKYLNQNDKFKSTTSPQVNSQLNLFSKFAKTFTRFGNKIDTQCGQKRENIASQ